MKNHTKEKLNNRFSYLSKEVDREESSTGEWTLVASQSIPKGKTVAVFGGKILSKKEALATGFQEYLPIDEELVMVCPIHDDGIDSAYNFKTSSTPNLGFKGPIHLVALREIKKGEELSYDPSMLSESVLDESNAEMEATRKKYNGNFSQFIQERINENSNLRVFPRFQEGAWGLLTSIDLENCNGDTIRSSEEIKRYVYELCELIDMKRFGDCHVVHFGEDERVAGFSMFQLIETSCISAHFANESNTSYIDIFSCKEYDPKLASEFTKKFFGGDKIRVSVTNRF
jgi:S-adenosylmethionine/arginine decarboxylase-like enzyme